MRSHVVVPLLSALPLAYSRPWGGGGWGWGWGSGNGNNNQPSWSWGGWGQPPSNNAFSSYAYFLYNDPAGSDVVSVEIGQDGLFTTNIAKTSTAGTGSVYLNATTNQPVAADSLGSQGSVVIKGNYLFTVNAGSDTVALFWINPANPAKPQLIGQPVSTLGNFPISLDYSPSLGKACVLNSGAKAGVTCFTVDPFNGLVADGPLRELSSSIIDQSTPPEGPPGTGGQVLFNPQSSAVFATIKGNPGPPTKLGSMVVWPVENGDISQNTPVVSTFDGVIVDFGFTFYSWNNIFLTDAGTGTALLEVQDNWSVTLKHHTVIADQSALCWSDWVPSLNTLYGLDAGRDQIYTINPNDGTWFGNITVSEPGVFDSFVSGQTLYALGPTAGAYVIDLENKTQLQYADLSGAGSRQYFQGLAQWPSVGSWW